MPGTMEDAKGWLLFFADSAADAYLRESFSAGEQYFDSFCQYICEKTEMIWEK